MTDPRADLGMSAEEIAEARRLMALGPPGLFDRFDARLLLRYARLLEAHAEAMAGGAETYRSTGRHYVGFNPAMALEKALKAFRAQFPRTEKDAQS